MTRQMNRILPSDEQLPQRLRWLPMSILDARPVAASEFGPPAIDVARQPLAGAVGEPVYDCAAHDREVEAVRARSRGAVT